MMKLWKIPSYYKPVWCWPWQAFRANTAYSKEYKKLLESLKPEIEALRQEYYPQSFLPVVFWAVLIEAAVIVGSFWFLSWVVKWECHPEALIRIFCY